MPKDGSIHKNYNEINVICTDNTQFITRSTYHNANNTMRLEVDTKTHPAWNPDAQLSSIKRGQVDGFNNRFEGLNFLDIKKSS